MAAVLSISVGALGFLSGERGHAATMQDSQISTAPASAPAKMDRLALGFLGFAATSG